MEAPLAPQIDPKGKRKAEGKPADAPVASTSKLADSGPVLLATKAEQAERAKRRIEGKKQDQSCDLSCTQTRGARHHNVPPRCRLDCTFDFRNEMEALAKLPGFKLSGETDRFRIKSLEGRFRLKASFPATNAAKHLENLQQPPIEIIARYMAAHAAYQEARPSFLKFLATPPNQRTGLLPVEKIKLQHLADKYQQPILRTEAHVKRVFTPIAERLSKIPEKWADGTFETSIKANVNNVYSKLASGDVLALGGKILSHGAGIVGQGFSFVAARVRDKVNGGDES